MLRPGKERGQAHLPDPELIRVAVVIVRRKAFNAKIIDEVQESQGREGGLAPAPTKSRSCTTKTLPLTVIVAKSYIQPSIIQPATDDARPTGFQKRPFKRKHQQPPVQFSGSKGLSSHVRKN